MQQLTTSLQLPHNRAMPHTHPLLFALLLPVAGTMAAAATTVLVSGRYCALPAQAVASTSPLQFKACGTSLSCSPTGADYKPDGVLHVVSGCDNVFFDGFDAVAISPTKE